MNTEQELASIRDTVPPIWWSLYLGSVAVGFDTVQAFALVQTWILSQNSNGIQPPRTNGPKPYEET